MTAAQVLSEWGWLAILAIAPLVFFVPAGSIFLLLVLVTVWTARKLSRGYFLPRTSLNFPILMISLAILLGLLKIDISHDLILRAGGYVYSVALFFEVVELGTRSERWWRRLVGVLLAGSLALSVVSLFGTDWLYKIDAFAPITRSLPPRLSNLVGPEGTFHPNIIAGSLLMGLPVLATAAALAFHDDQPYLIGGRWGRIQRASLLVSSLFVLSVFVLLQSRGAYLGLALAVMVLVPLALWHWCGISLPKLALLVALIGLLVLAAAVYLFPVEGGIALTGADLVSWLQYFPERLTMATRIEIWGNALELFRRHPLTGVGIGAFEPAVRANFTLEIVPEQSNFVHAHNHVLTVMAELGLVGLIAYAWLWVELFKVNVEAWQNADTPTSQLLSLGFAVAYLAFFLFGMTDTIALGTKPGVLFWYLMGVSIGFKAMLLAPADRPHGAEAAGLA